MSNEHTQLPCGPCRQAVPHALDDAVDEAREVGAATAIDGVLHIFAGIDGFLGLHCQALLQSCCQVVRVAVLRPFFKGLPCALARAQVQLLPQEYSWYPEYSARHSVVAHLAQQDAQIVPESDELPGLMQVFGYVLTVIGDA